MAPIAAIVALLIGAIAGPFLSQYVPIPNPANQKVVELENQVKQLESAIRTNVDIENKMPGVKISPEEVKRLQDELNEVTTKLKGAQQELQSLNTQLSEKQASLQAVEADIAAKNEQFVAAQEAYENLVNETEIVKLVKQVF
jgi:predicted  nucleic acid-binding Zn-ribbon protein